MQSVKPVDKKYGSWDDEARWAVKCMVCGGPIKRGWAWVRPENDGIECCTCAGCPSNCPGCDYIKEAAENEEQD